VFFWILELVRDQGVVKGKTMGIDATTLEANAAMRSIVRRDNGESYEDFLKGLAKESGIATPTREDLARLDRTRQKKASNKEWVNPHDVDARITKMKDGRTHLAHKAEHAVDLQTGAVLAVTLQEADQGGPPVVGGVKLRALPLGERIELCIFQQFIHSLVERMAWPLRQFIVADPQPLLPLSAPSCPHRHRGFSRLRWHSTRTSDLRKLCSGANKQKTAFHHRLLANN